MALTGRPKLEAVYRTGKRGARVVYRDGTVVQHAPHSMVKFSHHPLKVEGRLYPVSRSGALGYEVQPDLSHEVKAE
jgi:hypothetical protein